MPNPRSAPSRRRFLQTGAGLAAASAAAANAAGAGLPAGGAALFQGDSITDAGRDRERSAPNDARGFGRGYALLIASRLLADKRDPGLKIYNRGVSGDKVPDLDARWQADALDLEPDLLSILVGVNDLWHKLNGRYDGTVEQYEQGYAALLERTRRRLPKTRIVVCEPFVLRCGAVNEKWFPEFDDRRAAARRAAERAGAEWVGFQAMFDEAARAAPPEYWAPDGVHPSMAGHALMAETWLRAVKP